MIRPVECGFRFRPLRSWHALIPATRELNPLAVAVDFEEYDLCEFHRDVHYIFEG